MDIVSAGVGGKNALCMNVKMLQAYVQDRSVPAERSSLFSYGSNFLAQRQLNRLIHRHGMTSLVRTLKNMMV